MKEAIRQKALALGFDDCRFTDARSPDHANQLRDWLAQNHHGEMAYMQRNSAKRADPQFVLPGAKSVICLAASYSNAEDSGETNAPSTTAIDSQTDDRELLTPSLSPLGGERVTWPRELEVPTSSSSHVPVHLAGRGQVRGLAQSVRPSKATASGIIARYARFNDYHNVLGERLKALKGFVNQQAADIRSLWYVDTGPVLEREFAQRAGLGFIGKHTNLISRKLGNWIFLAEILTTLELPPDAPEKNRCGSCSRCLDACPTRAITAPFQLDARLCISYLTIELRGTIPVKLRPLIGNRIYGCDDCLAVCPWNRFAKEGALMRVHLHRELATPDLVELLGLDEASFKKRFAGTPILRAKRRGFLRNVCVALGNSGDGTALPALERATQDPEPLIAEHAAWAVESIEKRAD